MESRIHVHTDTELLVEWGPVLIRVLDGVTTTLEDIDLSCELFDSMLERYPAIASLAIVEHGTPLPSPTVRRYTTDRWSPYSPRMVSAVALLGLGFWAKAAIALTQKMMHVLRDGMILDTNVAGVTERLALELVGVDAEALTRYVEELRTRMHADVA